MVPASDRLGAEETPYVRARREWDDRYARQARAVRNWQIATLLALLMAAGLAAGLVLLASQSQITPYVVEVDRHGDAVAFGPAERLGPADERLLRYFLGRYVQSLRTVVADADAQRHLIREAYAFTTGEATAFLNDHYSRANPFELAQHAPRSVEVTSLLKVAETAWRAQWVERARPGLGRAVRESHWQAVLVVDQTPPTDTDTLLANPLGLYVTEITWQRTLTEGGTAP